MKKAKVFLTNGGTKVRIDDVRFLTNMSTGRYGAQIGAALLDREDAELHYFGAKDARRHPYNYSLNVLKEFNEMKYDDIYEYIDGVRHVETIQPDIIISAAAVSDYIMDKTEGKISSDNDELVITLKKGPKVLPLLRKAAPNATLVGFKLLVNPTGKQMYDAILKVLKSGANYVVYNDLKDIKAGDQTRYVFDENMNMFAAASSDELVEFILNEHNERIARIHG